MKKKWMKAMAVICLCSMGGPAYGAVPVAEVAVVESRADVGLGDELTKAIEQAKDTLGINSQVWDDFSYRGYDYGEGQRWALEWQRSDDDQQYLSAVIDEAGNIRSYQYSRPTDSSGLANIRQAEGAKIAEQFLLRIAGSYADSLALVTEQSTNQSRNNFRFVYQQSHAGLPVVDGTVTITVDRYTGSVVSCDVASGVNISGQGWADHRQAISLADAEKAMVKELGVELVYQASYRYQDKAYRIYPVYYLANNGQVIDGVTGKATPRNDEQMNLGQEKYANAEAAMDTGAGGRLSPKELAAVEKAAALLTKEQAADKLRQAVGLAENYLLENSNLDVRYDESSRYIWNLELSQTDSQQSISGTVDAQTGQLLSFYQYTGELEKLEQPQSKQQADEAVAAFLQQQAAAELGSSKLIPQQDDRGQINQYSYTYQRQVNGISFMDNGITVVYDASAGQITTYQLSWNKSAEFPAITAAKAPQEMVPLIAEQADFALQYQRWGEGYRLIYDFCDQSAMQFDPFTGQRLNRWGETYVAPVLPIYQWQGASHEKGVQLYENGIYLDKEQLNSSGTITQGEFAQLLYRSIYPYGMIDDEQAMYDELQSRGLITGQEQNPSALVTRQEAARYAVRLLGYDRLLTYSKLFAYPYSDQCAEQDRAAVAIAGAMELLTVDDDNRIRSQEHITQGETFDLFAQALS